MTPRPQEPAANIAIIGAGNIGGTLARRLAARHTVTIANSRGARTLAGLAAETGAHPRDLDQVARGADVVIVAIPLAAVASLAPDVVATIPPSAVVVETSNYVPYLRDQPVAELDAGAVESQWVAERLGRPVVKAFNTITAGHLRDLGRPAGARGRVALPVAGDDPAARATVLDLVDQVGFDGVDAGGLCDSWRQQPGTPVYTADLDADGVRGALAAATRAQTPAWRARLAGTPR